MEQKRRIIPPQQNFQISSHSKKSILHQRKHERVNAYAIFRKKLETNSTIQRLIPFKLVSRRDSRNFSDLGTFLGSSRVVRRRIYHEILSSLSFYRRGASPSPRLSVSQPAILKRRFHFPVEYLLLASRSRFVHSRDPIRHRSESRHPECNVSLRVTWKPRTLHLNPVASDFHPPPLDSNEGTSVVKRHI